MILACFFADLDSSNTCRRANHNQVLAALTAAGVAFCISTTSPKPRVPASITACKLDEYFPADKVRKRSGTTLTLLVNVASSLVHAHALPVSTRVSHTLKITSSFSPLAVGMRWVYALKLR